MMVVEAHVVGYAPQTKVAFLELGIEDHVLRKPAERAEQKKMLIPHRIVLQHTIDDAV